jgi:hypothetical protein
VLDNTDQYFANFQSVPQTSQTLAENLVHPKTDSSSHAETIQAAILQASNIRCKADRIHACISSPPPPLSLGLARLRAGHWRLQSCKHAKAYNCYRGCKTA